MLILKLKNIIIIFSFRFLLHVYIMDILLHFLCSGYNGTSTRCYFSNFHQFYESCFVSTTSCKLHCMCNIMTNLAELIVLLLKMINDGTFCLEGSYFNFFFFFAVTFLRFYELHIMQM